MALVTTRNWLKFLKSKARPLSADFPLICSALAEPKFLGRDRGDWGHIGYDNGLLVLPAICVSAAMASALLIASEPAAASICSRTKMRTAELRLRTRRLPGIGGSRR
jgi:hypothetical protein